MIVLLVWRDICPSTTAAAPAVFRYVYRFFITHVSGATETIQSVFSVAAGLY